MFELGNSFSWAITRQKRRPSHLTTRILNLYTEALTGFCLEYHAEWSQQCTALSRPLKKAPAMGTVGRMYMPRTGEGEHSPTAQAQLSVQPLVTFSWWPLPTLCSWGPPLPIPHAPPFFYALENSARGFIRGAGSFGGSLTALEQMSQQM